MLLGASLAAFTTAILIAVLTPLAHRIGLVDIPDHRKVHNGQVALVGGLAFYAGFWMGALTLEVSLFDYRAFFAASFLLVCVGVLDDFNELSARTRIDAQLIAALLMTFWGGVIVQNLGGLLPGGNVLLEGWSIPFTLVAVVGAINAMNLSDGLDGLGGGLAVVTMGSAAFLAWRSGVYREFALLTILVVTILVFLLFNLRSDSGSKVFMGDAGSMLLGFAVAWFLTVLSQGQTKALTPVTALWIFALPLLDTVAAMLRRILWGRSPFRADRAHIHHLLHDAGFSHRAATSIVLALAATFALIGIGGIMQGISEPLMFRGFLALFLAYFACIVYFAKKEPEYEAAAIDDRKVVRLG